MAAPPAPGARHENAFTRHVGPLPMWVWLAIIGGAIIVWALYERHKNAASTPTGSSATQPPEVIQTTPPEVNIYPGGKGPDEHHRRHRPRRPPGGVNPGGLNDPGPEHHRRRRERILRTEHRPPQRRHPSENVHAPRRKHKRRPPISNG